MKDFQYLQILRLMFGKGHSMRYFGWWQWWCLECTDGPCKDTDSDKGNKHIGGKTKIQHSLTQPNSNKIQSYFKWKCTKTAGYLDVEKI